MTSTTKRAKCLSGSHSSTDGGRRYPVARSIVRKLLTSAHPETKKGRINVSILPDAAQCAKSDRLLAAHAGVPQHRWGVFLNDFDQFIHGRGGWAERAADLGWDTLALFGCHPTRPLDHLNGAGLLWRMSGATLTCTPARSCRAPGRGP